MENIKTEEIRESNYASIWYSSNRKYNNFLLFNINVA